MDPRKLTPPSIPVDGATHHAQLLEFTGLISVQLCIKPARLRPMLLDILKKSVIDLLIQQQIIQKGLNAIFVLLAALERELLLVAFSPSLGNSFPVMDAAGLQRRIKG